MPKYVEWIFSGIGVYLLTALLGLIGYLLRKGWRLDPRLERLIGNYEGFQLRIRNDGTILRSAVSIRRRGINGLHVELSSYRYHYEGSCKITGHNVFFELEEASHDGFMYMIFKEPVSSFNVLVGVYAAIASNRRPVAGKVVFKKSELTGKAGIPPAFLPRDAVPDAILKQLASATGSLLIVEDLPVNLLEEIGTTGG